MSNRLIQDLHAGISRRDWSAVETAANRLRDEVEQATRILAASAMGSLPSDYPLSELAADALNPTPAPILEGDGAASMIECLAAGEPFVFDPATNFLHADDGTVEGGIRYLPADTTITVTVKPLEWRHFDSGDASARSVITAYFAHTDGTWCVRNGDRIQAGSNIDAAKAAAQADYDARILSCISATTTEGE